MRSDLSAKLSRQFDAQGIASVTVPSPTSRNRLVVTLLAAGSGEPDVIDVNLDSPDAAAMAVGKLDRGLLFFKPSLGLTVVDVADLEGPVVVAVDPNGPGARSGIQPGDVVLKANSQPVPDAATLTTLLDGRKADEELTLESEGQGRRREERRREGADDAAVDRDERSVADDQQDPRRPESAPALTRRAHRRFGDAPEPRGGAGPRRPVVGCAPRAAAREVERWPGRLERHGPVPAGSVAERMGNAAEAEAAWRAAAATTALITEDGLPVKELAEARLQGRRPGAQ